MEDKYLKFRCEDFALDTFFIEWVRCPNTPLDAYWQAFKNAHPSLSEEMDAAVLIVKSIRFEEKELLPENKEQLWSRIQKDTNPTPKRYFIYYAAASIVLLMGMLWLFQNEQKKTESVSDPIMKYAAMQSQDTVTGQEVQLVLADESNIAIHTEQASIRYDQEG
ncbi:MAG: hypothetical protein LBU62_08305, partial [Bacteroidales bacterium]|nr:hypothetical protein [Bacteroidales bacterium]